MASAVNNEAKILTIDIETRPSLAYIWSLWDTFTPLERLIEQGEMISFAAKWYGKKPVEFYSVFHDGQESMLKAAWDLVHEADVIVHYNGRKFDYPHLRTEWLLHDVDSDDQWGSPSPVRQVDLLQVAKTFKFASNKLDHIAKELKLGGKVKHTGFQLWIDCMANDPDAWELMKKYNKHDVVLTEQLYTRLRGWITSGHPNVGLFKDGDVAREETQCEVCGSTSYQKRGEVPTNTALYQQYRCNDCGHWFRSAKQIGRTTTRSIGLG